jgi:tRNA A37 methylthiotransferase MiaB
MAIVSDSVKRSIGLVQIAEVSWSHRTREQYHFVDGMLLPKASPRFDSGVQSTYLPLAIGSLQGYVQKYSQHPDRFAFLPPLFKRVQSQTALDALACADVIAFSVYVWNANISLEIARRVKKRNPRVLVVFGGPQVPDHAEPFLRENRQVDLACHGEGERAFLRILEELESRDWSVCPSVSYLDRSGDFHVNPRIDRLSDLAELPSPYVDGVFDELMAANSDRHWMALWETNRGCPFSCTFCDWGSAVGSKVTKFTMARLLAELDWFVARRIAHLFICDANFGILPRDLEIVHHLIERYEAAHLPLAISVQNTKNAPERAYQIQRALTASRLMSFGVTLSMQSVSAPVLDAIRRDNISLAAFRELHHRYQRDGVETYSDLIVGLPGETYDSFADGISLLLDQGQHNRVAFYNCSVLPNAEMGEPHYQEAHGIEYVPVEIIREHEVLGRGERGEVPEYLNTVVATATMNRDNWIRSRVFAWFVELLHFDRTLQIVFILLHHACDISFRHLIEAFVNADHKRHPVCGNIHQLFIDQARAIQRGEPEFIPSPEWLNIWWPADQFALVRLVAEGKVGELYDEAQAILTELLEERGLLVDPILLADAVALNRGMLRGPCQFDDLELELSYNVLECYLAILRGNHQPLRRTPSRYRIDRSSTVWISTAGWSEDVVMQVYRRSNFLYPVCVVEIDDTALGVHAEAATERGGGVQESAE